MNGVVTAYLDMLHGRLHADEMKTQVRGWA
jgi:hypothetical protein